MPVEIRSLALIFQQVPLRKMEGLGVGSPGKSTTQIVEGDGYREVVSHEVNSGTFTSVRDLFRQVM